MSWTTKYPYVQYRIRWKVRRCAVRSAANGPAPGEWFAGCPVRRADKPAVLKPPAALSFSLLLLMPTTVHRRTPLPGHRDGFDSETCLTATFVVATVSLASLLWAATCPWAGRCVRLVPADARSGRHSRPRSRPRRSKALQPPAHTASSGMRNPHRHNGFRAVRCGCRHQIPEWTNPVSALYNAAI